MAVTKIDYEKDMQLPAGKTCADCYAVRFCVGIGCTKPDATKCDYHPNRFHPKKPEQELCSIQ